MFSNSTKERHTMSEVITDKDKEYEAREEANAPARIRR